ncbi:unnamed protein product [marine sediment metagenome]|uniref:Uncharacterized protein n=1 Tax=marine sediment metagenome TaxID=412755 RepID=X1P8R2_9ZZZZ
MEEASKQQKPQKRVSDIIGDGKIEFHPEYERIDLADIMGKDVMFMGATILKDWPSDYAASGKASWCIMWIQDMDTGVNYTTKCGGLVLVKRISELIAKRAFPVIGSIVSQGGTERPYYNII